MHAALVGGREGRAISFCIRGDVMRTARHGRGQRAYKRGTWDAAALLQGQSGNVNSPALPVLSAEVADVRLEDRRWERLIRVLLKALGHRLKHGTASQVACTV